MQGVIRFCGDKFGFVECREVDRAVFFPRSMLVPDVPLSEDLRGRAVRFELGEDLGRGPRASKVELLP